VAASIRLAPTGKLLDGPSESPSPRVYIEGGHEGGYAITAAGLRILRDDPEQRATFAACALDFRAFLDVWTFTPPGSPPRILGDDLWAAQEMFVSTVERESFVYFLKARQLGETTVACAFDGWVARFGKTASRVHLFCQRDSNAVEMVEHVATGLEALPPALRLPMRASAHTIQLNAGPHDKRTIRAYPANSATRGSTCTHAHVDELAAMSDPLRVFAAVEPSVQPGGSIHVLTTGNGPSGFAADFWRKAVAGGSEFAPCFCDALQRPDRDDDFLEAKRRSMDSRTFSAEYPMTWQDALAGAGEYLFPSEDVDNANLEAVGCFPNQHAYELVLAERRYDRRRRYVGGVDPGTVDATVVCILDATEQPYQLVGFYYLSPATVGSIQNLVRQAHLDWPDCKFLFEITGLGRGILPNIRAPESHLQGFETSRASKQGMIGELQLHLARGWLKWIAADAPQLDSEMRGYKEDDKNLTQDTVMSLGIALEAASSSKFPEPGRILRPILVG